MNTGQVDRGVYTFHQTIVALVRRDGRDLTARQLGVLLTSYLDIEAQTVRGLAANLNISKPAITRTLDRLSEFNLVQRKADPLDRRSILVQRTIAGTGFLRDLRKIIATAHIDAQVIPNSVNTAASSIEAA
jgi:DNA-binding MarR family transcriptional regulator